MHESDCTHSMICFFLSLVLLVCMLACHSPTSCWLDLPNRALRPAQFSNFSSVVFPLDLPLNVMHVTVALYECWVWPLASSWNLPKTIQSPLRSSLLQKKTHRDTKGITSGWTNMLSSPLLCKKAETSLSVWSRQKRPSVGIAKRHKMWKKHEKLQMRHIASEWEKMIEHIHCSMRYGLFSSHSAGLGKYTGHMVIMVLMDCLPSNSIP